MDFDIASHIGALTRRVVMGERDGKPAHIVIASRGFSTGIDDAWDAVTNAERLPRWFSPVTGELRLGGRYQVEGNASGTVERCDPPRRLALTWEFAGNVSWVEVDLEEEPDGTTRLELRHIAVLDEDYLKFWDQFGPGAGGVGWDLSFLGLAWHLEKGWDKPPETDTEWVKTDEYRSFVAASSAGWHDASIALGTDPAAAAQARDATTSFYTGG